LTGCATLNINKPIPNSNPNLPTVKKFKAYPGRNAIALFWTPVPNMSGYYIQKYNTKSKKWIEIATIKNPYKSIYVDTGLKPNHLYKYKIATFNKNGIPSLAKETDQKTLPKLAPVIPLEAKPIVKGEIKIIFRPSLNERVDEYIIQRYNNKKAQWENIATLKPRLNVEYIDTGLKDGTTYKYRIFAKSFDGIISYPSKVLVTSTFPKPPIVMNEKATINLPKKIVLTFTPVKNAAKYKIYISSSPNGDFHYYKTITSTKFVDHINKDGYVRFYKVIAVSKYGTESILNETPAVMGETLPKPVKPIVSTTRNGNKIAFIFTSPDGRAVKYLIIKKEKTGLFKSKKTEFITKSNRFVDTIQPKHSYTYEIYEVDKYGLISKNPAVIEVD